MVDLETEEFAKQVIREMFGPFYLLIGYVVIACILLFVLNRFIKISSKINKIIASGAILLVFYIWVKATFL